MRLYVYTCKPTRINAAENTNGRAGSNGPFVKAVLLGKANEGLYRRRNKKRVMPFGITLM